MMLQPWHWRSLPLDGRTGSQVFSNLFLDRQAGGIATLLESPNLSGDRCPPTARYSICAGAPRTYGGRQQVWTPPVGQIFPFLRDRAALGHSIPDDSAPAHLPFIGGWLGWLGYDLAWEIERLPHLNADPLPFPVAYWYEPECFAVLDLQRQDLWLAASDPAQLDELEAQLNRDDPQPAIRPEIPSPRPEFQLSPDDYKAIVQHAREYIRAGDIFQANLSLRFSAQTTDSSWEIYRSLQQINPSPFASYWQTPWGAVISCSPERLIALDRRQAETRPIAGTRSRGSDPEGDLQQERDLLTNRKERAEHIMLVDLERNDLGRVCEWGSVRVNELLAIERYSHVMHLVSNVIGTLHPQYDGVDLIRAMFPGGTITGCPKVRCMEIIEELEPVRRNLFYGSCGYFDARGNLDLNIAIRTLLWAGTPENATVWGQVGAGIVADSDPEREWHESIDKARAQLTALSCPFP